MYDSICTKENPWKGSITGLVPDKHPDLKKTKSGKYKCPHCGIVFDIK